MGSIDSAAHTEAGVGDGTYAVDSWRALGTYVQLVVAQPSLMPAARALAVEQLAAVDLACSRFRDDSDLARVNRGAGDWVPVSPLLVDALDAALGAADATDGLVDPSLGRQLVALGYDADLEIVRGRAAAAPGTAAPGTAAPGTAPTDLALGPAPRAGWRQIEIDRGQCAVRIPFDVGLDLGATGKAFAADLISSLIAARIGVDCIVSLGGDVAIGDSGSGVPHAWQVAISETPQDDDAETLTLPAGGLATSSTVRRRWTTAGRTVHHLLDPSTGLPVERCWRTASVIAPTCVAANTASTAALVLGEHAVMWLTTRNLAARLVDTAGTVTWTGHWPAQTHDGAAGSDGNDA